MNSVAEEYKISEDDIMYSVSVNDAKRYARNRELAVKAQNGDDSAMEEIVIENTALVKSIAYKFRDRGCEMDDLIQIGMLGMIKAVKSFDESRNTGFSTYAVPLIIGEIRRHLRDSGLIRVSRIYRKNGTMLMREKNRILNEEGREPRLEELARACGLTLEEAAIALDSMSPIASLNDRIGDDDSMTLESTIPDDSAADEMEAIVDKIALAEAIKHLDELARKIILMRYFRNMTQQEVADMLGLTQVKVSREEKRILQSLRREMS